jgi:hypothetical protein
MQTSAKFKYPDFNNLHGLFEKYNFPPNRIFNLDESGIFNPCIKSPKMIGQKGKILVI